MRQKSEGDPLRRTPHYFYHTYRDHFEQRAILGIKMSAEYQRREEKASRDEENNDLKIHISRVPTKFDEAVVLRILKDQLLLSADDANDDPSGDGDDVTPPIQVALVYPRPDEEGEGDNEKEEDAEAEAGGDEGEDAFTKEKATDKDEHRGFGFITFQSKELYEKALALSTIKGGSKPNSKKLRTMHLRAYTTEPDEVNLCYLWTNRRCPYGDDCKFTHSGPGACLPATSSEKKRGKCFAYKKGKCSKGDECPFSHDFEPSVEEKPDPTASKNKTQSEKDCINWKTKGKCRKGDKCPYRHDPELLKKLQEKKNKRKRESGDDIDDGPSSEKKKTKQPLCIRVFGMAYDTTEEDIRAFFESCGKIQDIRFPSFEDSGRSKGYCGIWFTSPKAVDKAIELNGQELMGRWLSVQAGKMMLREWEANHAAHAHEDSHEDPHALVETN
jgi:RNA recognition motif-containing protein